LRRWLLLAKSEIAGKRGRPFRCVVVQDPLPHPRNYAEHGACDMTTTVDAGKPPAMSHSALFLRFIKFGCLAFGGPVAQIAMIKRELVERERWMEPAHFNRLLAVMQVLPGPEAQELCVHLGIRAKGRLGGLLAGLGFMLPGLILMMALAWAYVRFGLAQGPLEAAFLGVQVSVIAVIVRAVHRIGTDILEDPLLWGLAMGAGIATLVG
jgi:chromate transporter